MVKQARNRKKSASESKRNWISNKPTTHLSTQQLYSLNSQACTRGAIDSGAVQLLLGVSSIMARTEPSSFKHQERQKHKYIKVQKDKYLPPPCSQEKKFTKDSSPWRTTEASDLLNMQHHTEPSTSTDPADRSGGTRINWEQEG
jgi:hypothetical protein